MAYFADMGTATQIASSPFVRAVGWLAASVSYATGDVPPEFVRKLRALATQWGLSTVALGWPVAGGPHTCEMCGRVQASGNFGVPGGDVLYVAPEMIAHYVEGHRYAPPDTFVAAVLACPSPDTGAYEQAVRPFVRTPTVAP
jgi:hypothetical protein